MARQLKGAALAAEVETQGEPGPIAQALDKLIAGTLQPEVEAAKADVVRTEDEHAKALEFNAAHNTDENTRRVHETWVAMQTAPAILYRAESVSKNVQALRDSEEVREADRQLTESDGTRAAFMSTLETLKAEVEQHAAQLAESIAKVHRAHAEHTLANAHVKDAVASIAATLKTLHEPVDLVRALGRGALESFDARNAELESARAVKTALAKTLGGDRAYRFQDALRVVG